METINNLPPQPYKKFFGRTDAIKKIYETLIEGGTFIASIDGVGGIGKTALAYHFCKEHIIPQSNFKYLIWITSKNTVFDPYSIEKQIKIVENEFKGIETLFDTTFSVVGLEELINSNFKEKKEFFLNEIISTEPIFFVLDNLENINDQEFFEFVSKYFNKYSADNKYLKILTTSRKRKRLADFPVEIEGLDVEDALYMLKHLAKEYQIKDVLKSNDHDNIILIEKVGRIPLGIEFLIGQMSLGKSRGQIYQELEGYPSVEKVNNDSEKKKRLSDIILFSFKDMYETLDNNHQTVFQVITSLEKNKRKGESSTSLELLMSITGYSRFELENILDTLTDNKLIVLNNSGEYSVNQMAINFVKQFYENFEKIEDEVIGKKTKILKGERKFNDRIDIILNSVELLIQSNDYEKAEEELLKALDVAQDFRIYFELAKIQRILSKYSKASDNFRIATEFNPTDAKIWYEWINLEDSRGRYNIALEIIERALDKTNKDVSIVNQKINIYKYKKDFDMLRTVANQFLDFYKLEKRTDDYIRLLRSWKNIEYKLVLEDKKSNYLKAADLLIEAENEPEIKLQILNEQLNIVRKIKLFDKEQSIKQKIKIIESNVLKTIGGRTKQLNSLFNQKKYDEAKSEARKILNWIRNDDKNEEHSINALRVLLQILATEKDYQRIIITFEDYKHIGYKDNNCQNIYEKAIKEINKQKKDELIQKISINIQESEYELRIIILTSLNNDENKLRELLTEKGKKDWIEQWELTKAKSLSPDANIIHYSDISHLRSLLSWCKEKVLYLSKDSANKYKNKELLKNIVAILEGYVNQERNETFHSRLQLFELERLEDFLADTRRLLQIIKTLKDNLTFD